MNLSMNVGGVVIINDVKYHGGNISIRDGVVILDGVRQSQALPSTINVVVHGDVSSLSNVNKAMISGDCTTVSTVSGDVTCKDVHGNVESVSGDIDCLAINGSVRTISGDIFSRG